MEKVRINKPDFFLSGKLRENNVFKVDKITWYDMEPGFSYDGPMYTFGTERDTTVYFYDDFVCIETTLYNDGLITAPEEHSDLIMIHKTHILEITNPRPVNIINIKRVSE